MILDDFLHSVFGLAFIRVLIPASIAFWMVTYQRIDNVRMLPKLSAKFWVYGFLSSALGVSLFWSQVYSFYYGSIAANAMESLSDLIIFLIILPGISAYFSYSLLKKFKKELSL
jgi:hypothetical protein